MPSPDDNDIRPRLCIVETDEEKAARVKREKRLKDWFAEAESAQQLHDWHNADPRKQ